MKPSADNWESPDELEKLLFDYLEGNLAEEQARELEQKAATDMLLRSEMESWKDTVLVQEFYDTSQLEQQLVLPEKPFMHVGGGVSVGTSATRLFLFAMLVCLTSLWPVKMEKAGNSILPEAAIVAPVQAHTPRVTPVPIPAVGKEPIQVRVSPEEKQHSGSNPLVEPVKHKHLSTFSRISVAPLAVPQNIVPVLLPEAGNKKIRVPKMAAPRTITRKQARQIARMKEKALQRRMANEFLKGRVPYVVPLNSRNF